MNSFLNSKKSLYLFIVLAFTFSVVIHFVWLYLNYNNPQYFFNSSPIINTNDGYFFASGVQKALYGMHQNNPLVPGIWERGLVFITTLLAKILPISLDSLIFYMPAIFSSVIVIPLILIGYLYKKPLWGFLSALLASIAWSYYNRTLVGYYDTDMFALTVPFFILYFLIKSAKEFDFKSVYIAALIFSIYPFLYIPGKMVAYALAIMYAFYMLIFYYKKDDIFKFLILVFISVTPFHLPNPYEFLLKIFLLTIIYFYLKKNAPSKKNLIIAFAIIFIAFLFSSEAVLKIVNKVISYTKTGVTEDSLHFYGVMQTISEASGIPFLPNPKNPYASNVAYRIIGSVFGFFIFLGGYIWLVIKKREFLIALPLVGIGLFAHWGGLRFTVYAVPIAALSAMYIFFWISDLIDDKSFKKFFNVVIVVVAALLIYPNIKHALEYNPGVVFKKDEIKDLIKLKNIAKDKDYTLSWWDYGYPLWYFTNTNTLIDGGKHHHDNFIISTIFMSDSQTLAANLARLSVEEYIKRDKAYKEFEKSGKLSEKYTMIINDNKVIPSPYSPIIDNILRVNQKNQKDPNEFLNALENINYNLPKKSVDIYLYAPYKMIGIIPAIEKFSNVNLTTGKRKRDVLFLPLYLRKKAKDSLIFSNGMKLNYKNGTFTTGNGLAKLRYFIISQISNNGDIKVIPQIYNKNSQYVIIFVQNYGTYILMDIQTFKSNFVQMFLLGNYDKDLFELVVKSPYSRVYKLKK